MPRSALGLLQTLSVSYCENTSLVVGTYIMNRNSTPLPLWSGQKWRHIGLPRYVRSVENKKPLKAILAALSFGKSALTKMSCWMEGISNNVEKHVKQEQRNNFKLSTGQKSILMTGMLFSSVEWQKKSQKPLLLFRISKTALIKITILSVTLLMRTTQGILISHLCHNRWCLFYEAQRKGCCSIYEQREIVDSGDEDTFLFISKLLLHTSINMDVKLMKFSTTRSLVLYGRPWGWP